MGQFTLQPTHGPGTPLTPYRQLWSQAFSSPLSRSPQPWDRKEDTEEVEVDFVISPWEKCYNFVGCIVAIVIYFYLLLYSNYLWVIDTACNILLAEYCAWSNERLRRKGAKEDRPISEKSNQLSMAEKGDYFSITNGSPDRKLDSIAAVVGYREDPTIFTKALESYRHANGCRFLLVSVDGNGLEDQVMVDVFQKVCCLVFLGLEHDSLECITDQPIGLPRQLSRPEPSGTIRRDRPANGPRQAKMDARFQADHQMRYHGQARLRREQPRLDWPRRHHPPLRDPTPYAQEGRHVHIFHSLLRPLRAPRHRLPVDLGLGQHRMQGHSEDHGRDHGRRRQVRWSQHGTRYPQRQRDNCDQARQHRLLERAPLVPMLLQRRGRQRLPEWTVRSFPHQGDQAGNIGLV